MKTIRDVINVGRAKPLPSQEPTILADPANIETVEVLKLKEMLAATSRTARAEIDRLTLVGVEALKRLSELRPRLGVKMR